MRQQLFRATLTALTLAALVSPPAPGEEAPFTGARVAERAIAAARPAGDASAVLLDKLQGQVGQFNTGCSHSAWTTGQTGVCVLMVCDSGCSALKCTYDSGYVDGYVELSCIMPPGGGIF